MKKFIYLIMGLSMVLTTSCDPMEDINEEISSETKALTGNLVYTLTDKDYTTTIEDGGFLGQRFANFSTEADAKELIPNFLLGEYPFWGEGSVAEINYKLYFPKRNEKSLIVYQVRRSDYTAAGLQYPNISNDSQMTQLLNHLYPSPANRVLVSLTYTERDSGVNYTTENGFIYTNGVWEKSMGITSDEYSSLGEVRAQFSSEEEALAKIPLFLDSKAGTLTPKNGDIQGVMYKLYVTDTQDVDGDGRTNDKTVYSYVVYYMYNGTNWSKYGGTINQTLKLGFIDGKWTPDNTIKYTLTNDDYELVGNGFYNNFDVRTGKDEETEEVRLEKINTILINNFPSAEEGQKFVVSYKVYSGVNEVWELKLIKTGSVYIKQ